MDNGQEEAAIIMLYKGRIINQVISGISEHQNTSLISLSYVQTALLHGHLNCKHR
jgi:hypothetical protein